MSSRNSSRKRFAEWSRTPAPHDETDPLHAPLPAPAPRFDRKALQLCRQVSRTLSYTLSECGDQVLSDLFVESVEPAPDASRLLITVMTADPEQGPAEIPFQHIGILSLEFHVDKLSRPLL